MAQPYSKQSDKFRRLFPTRLLLKLNRKRRSRHQWKKTTVSSCHRCPIKAGV